MKNTYIIAFCLMLSFISYAGFHCPDDITINCDMDVHNTDMTGYPNTTGLNVGLPISYSDIDLTNGCGVGQVNRTWYQDLNNDGVIGADEPSCTQIITVEALDSDIFDINWPLDLDLSCVADISFEAPVIVHGPCDLVGYIYEDQVFELTNDACYKILRRFEVINWCEYDASNPTGSGLYTHTQVIKVTEKEIPEFTSCEDVTIAMDEGCQANVTITSSAFDTGDCPSELLFWTVEVDLDWDLVVDYEYSYLLTGEFNLAPTANGEDISITLPDLVNGGMHGVLYTVKDGCGNVRSCQQRILVEDQKAPTPYCHAFLTAAFDADAMPAMIPADLFDIGATDNCTDPENIKISFSADTADTIKEITCGNQGFQFFNIYATDEAGNADFCEVFMLIFDNDGCQFRYAPIGTVRDIEGNPVKDVNVYLTDGNQAIYETRSAGMGYFQFEYTELISDYYIMTELSQEQIEEPTIADLKYLQDYMLGLESLHAPYQYVAADINRDHSINPFDIIDLKNHLLGVSELNKDAFMTYIESESISENWVNYKTEIDYMDYDGSFDLLQVRMSDMYDDINQELSQLQIDQIIDDSKTVMAISNETDMSSDGVEVSVKLATGLNMEQIALTSDILDINSSDYHYNANTGLLKLVSLESIEVSAGEAWLTIRISGEKKVYSDININWVQDNTLVRSQINNKSINTTETETGSYPLLLSNIVEQELSLRNGLEFGTIDIYDMRGNIVYNAVNVGNQIDLPFISPGMYIAKWSHMGASKEEKFIKQ